jgi:cytochrome bd-type quinol oxidase subunit 2
MKSFEVRRARLDSGSLGFCMIEAVRLLILPVIVVAAWLFSRRHSELARKSARLISLLFAFALAVMALTGWVQSQETIATIHRWAGHAFLIGAWLFVPFATGVLLQQQLRRRPVLAIAASASMVLLLGLVVAASITGYLGPSHQEHFSDETHNRFIVLHFCVLPGLISLLLIAWFWSLRPYEGHPFNGG